MTVTFAGNEAGLEVRDNGVGFSVFPVSGGFTASGQLGLLGMQERAELLGGKLEVQSSSEKGTTVMVSIPTSEGISEVSSHHLAL